MDLVITNRSRGLSRGLRSSLAPLLLESVYPLEKPEIRAAAVRVLCMMGDAREGNAQILCDANAIQISFDCIRRSPNNRDVQETVMSLLCCIGEDPTMLKRMCEEVDDILEIIEAAADLCGKYSSVSSAIEVLRQQVKKNLGRVSALPSRLFNSASMRKRGSFLREEITRPFRSSFSSGVLPGIRDSPANSGDYRKQDDVVSGFVSKSESLLGQTSEEPRRRHLFRGSRQLNG